jgi:PAS domain S-box-containing protein
MTEGLNMTEGLSANEHFRLAIEATPTGMLMIDARGRIVLVNAQVEQLFGYTRQELLGQSVDMLVPERLRRLHSGHRSVFLHSPETRLMGGGRDLYGVRKDGSEVPLEIGLNPLQTNEGTLVLSSVVDITERKRSMDLLRLSIEAAPTGMMLIAEDGNIALINAQVEELFGYKREELVGMPVEVLVPERFRREHAGFRAGFLRKPAVRAMGAGRDLYGLRKNGTEVPIEIGLNPLQTASGEFVLSSIVDITERKRGEQALLALNAELEERVRARTFELTTNLKEREVLLQEVHHRVKNNLQVIASLINLQMRQLHDSLAVDALQECKSRVEAIALIHEKLYQSKDYARVPFADYARSLAANIFHATGISPSKIALRVEIEPVALPVNKAIPCGLILNELITNALKHGFPDGRRGLVKVELGAHDGRVILAVADTGVGMSADADPANSKSLGLQLVQTLVEQLEGRLELVRENGTTLRITFSG